MIIVLAFTVSFFFAMNIGASGAAASMGIAYGSGAVKTRRIALLICAAGVLLGAVLGGGEVAKTLGSGLIPKELISINISLIILSSAAISLFIATMSGIPLSTSEVTVGAIIGVGIAVYRYIIVYYDVLDTNSCCCLFSYVDPKQSCKTCRSPAIIFKRRKMDKSAVDFSYLYRIFRSFFSRHE